MIQRKKRNSTLFNTLSGQVKIWVFEMYLKAPWSLVSSTLHFATQGHIDTKVYEMHLNAPRSPCPCVCVKLWHGQQRTENDTKTWWRISPLVQTVKLLLTNIRWSRQWSMDRSTLNFWVTTKLSMKPPLMHLIRKMRWQYSMLLSCLNHVHRSHIVTFP